MSFDNSSSPTPTATNREEELVTARSLTFVTLPEDILRLFFDTAFHSETQEDKQCRRTARNCCLVSKALKAWVEPMLYQKVVLETSKQVLAFLNTMWLKRDEFLARAVKSIWILDKTFTVDMLYESYLIFAKCQSLDNFACLGFEPCIRVLQNIPKPRNGRYKLRELAIMQPDSESVRHFSLRYLSIQTLQFINSKESFLDTLFQRLGVDEELLDALRVIPRICFDSIHVPNVHLSNLLKHRVIPLLLLKVPEATNRIYIRVGHRGRRHKLLSSVDDWIRAFDTCVQQYGDRLNVSGVEGSTKNIDLERAKAWIGLE